MYPRRTGSGLWLLRDDSRWRHDGLIGLVNHARERLSSTLSNHAA
jgi:hypothetical protein